MRVQWVGGEGFFYTCPIFNLMNIFLYAFVCKMCILYCKETRFELSKRRKKLEKNLCGVASPALGHRRVITYITPRGKLLRNSREID